MRIFTILRGFSWIGCTDATGYTECYIYKIVYVGNIGFRIIKTL